MSDERQPCRSCAGMLSDFPLLNALKWEEGVNFSHTAHVFYTAVDNGCLVSLRLHELACHYVDFSETETAAFRCGPQSSSDAGREIIMNVQFETTRADSYDFKTCHIAAWSPEHRYISTVM